ncbi:MAG: DUF3105 domain-containing protein [Rubrobacter sp.]|nr:DUF3105 domain-containing protein [Rubrobacter sp.]
MSRSSSGGGGGLSRNTIIVGVIALAMIGSFVAVVIADARQGGTASGEPEGVETFEDLSRDHTNQPVSYEQDPPVGGPHTDVWQNCGFYEEPVPNEPAVHSLEHGAVWVTHDPGLEEDQVEELRTLAEENSYVLVSPYEGLASPVVASAWGHQVELEGAGDENLQSFVEAYQQGPQTPEPGASCSGGTGEPAA